MERVDVLRSLLKLSLPLGVIKEELRKFEWDCDKELVLLNSNDAVAALKRFLNGEFDAVEIEEWADTIECREDIGFQSGKEKVLADMVHKLANPLLSQPLTKEGAEQWILRLEGS